MLWGQIHENLNLSFYYYYVTSDKVPAPAHHTQSDTVDPT